MINNSFWKNKAVFLTGHTGFKGSWMVAWLEQLGARVTGFSLPPPTNPSMFETLGLAKTMESLTGDIRNLDALQSALKKSNAEIVIHMAAQPLVRYSYQNPVETYATNVMGTVNVLEAVRSNPQVRAVVIVTTDKCYENQEWLWGYRESEPMGGYDPYSSSKGCAELVTNAYRKSFFNPAQYGKAHNTLVASARAGNVIGGGDWAQDRLIPDIVQAISDGRPVTIRSPFAIRPWQHVLEPVGGYLVLAERLYSGDVHVADGWNFGPDDLDAKPVEWIVKRLCELYPESKGYQVDTNPQPHEAGYLKLDCSKAKQLLHWTPTWTLDIALEKIVEWHQSWRSGNDVLAVTRRQIKEFQVQNS